MAITGASLQPIYDRLHAATPYHPMSANTFADWSVEAGDIVSMSRGGETISVPVHSTNISWRGSPMVKLNATGKEERDSIAKTSKRKYGGSGAGMRNNQSLYYEMFSEDGKLHTELMYSESILRIEFTNADSRLEGEISITASALRAEYMDGDERLRGEIEVTASHIYADYTAADSRLEGEIEVTASHLTADYIDRDERLRGEFELTASHLRSEFQDADANLQGELELTASMFQTELVNTASGLSSRIQQTADKVAIVVDSNNNIKAAQIVASINNGASTIILSADHIDIDGLVTKLESQSIGVGALHVEGDAEFLRGLYSESTIVAEEEIRSNTGFSVYGISLNVADATVSGNVLTITYVDGSTETFSKATALSPEWSGRTYTVEATQNGQRVGIVSDSVYVFPQGTAQYSNFSISVAHTTPTAENELPTTREYVYLVEDVAGKKVDAKYQNATTGSIYASVSTADTWEDGRDSGWSTAVGKVGSFSVTAGTGLVSINVPGSTYNSTASKSGTISLSKGSWSNGSLVVTAKFENSEARTTTVDVGNSSNWSSTYVNGGKMSVSCKVADKSFTSGAITDPGYSYGVADGEAKFTLASVTLQGSQDSVYISASSGGSTYYTAGTTATYYNKGTAVTLYPAGTATTYYRGNGARYSSATRYTKGTATTYYKGNGTRLGNSGTYYKGNGGSFTVQGSSTTVTPVGTRYYYVQHASGTTPTGVWYTRTIAKPSSGTYDERYAAGTATTYYNAGTTTKYARGDSVTAYPTDDNGSNYLRGDSESVEPVGNAETVLITNGQGTYYLRGDSVSVTPIGTAQTITPIGTSVEVTPINANNKINNLTPTIRYKAGSTVSNTYYTKTG